PRRAQIWRSWRTAMPSRNLQEKRMNPLRYEPLVGQLDGLFNELFRPAYVLDPRAETAPIRVDVKEDAAGYTVHAELPGVKKENINIEIEGNEVTIAAEVNRGVEA